MDSRHILPTIVERDSRVDYALDPYSKLLADRIVFLGTAVDDVTANDVMAQLLYLDYAQPERDISLYINSPGGSITAMSAIYDTMCHISSDVGTVCLGQAASAAAILLAAGAPGKRLMLPHSRVLLHQPMLGGSEGQASDLEITAREILRVRAQMEQILTEHTGQSPDRIRRDLERDTIFDATEAVAYGLVDELLPVRQRRAA